MTTLRDTKADGRYWSGADRPLMVAAVALCTLAALLRIFWLMQVRGPYGIDGYGYVLAMNDVTTHAMAGWWFHAPIVLLVGLRALIGDDALAIKVAAVVMSWLLTLGVVRLVQLLSRQAGAALAAAALVATAAYHNLFVIDFFEELAGAAALTWAAVELAKIATRPPQRVVTPWLTAVAFALLATLSHPAAGVIASALLLGVCLASVREKQAGISRGLMWASCLGVIVVAIAAGLGSLADTAPAELIQIVPSPAVWHHPSWAYSLILMTVAVAAAIDRVRRRRGVPDSVLPGLRGPVVWTLLLAGLCFVGNPFFRYGYDSDLIANRLAMWGWLLCGMLIPVLPFARDGSHTRTSGLLGGALGLCALLAGAEPGLPIGADPQLLLSRERMAAALRRVPHAVLDGKLVVVGYGHQLAFTHATGMAALSAYPSTATKAWWLVRTDTRDMSWPSETIRFADYVLVPDDVLRGWLSGLDRPTWSRVIRQNPFQRGAAWTRASATRRVP